MTPTRRLPPLNPVLARELKQRMRGRQAWVVLTLYLGILAVILHLVYRLVSRVTGGSGAPDALFAAAVGRSLFQTLLFFALMLVCFIVPGLTAGAIAGERERQTLVSLQVTLLRARSIVAGKLLASLAFVVLLVVATLPLVGVSFLVGGVSVAEVLAGFAMVLVVAVALAAVALACSAMLRRTQTATVSAYAVTLALVVGTFILYGAQLIVTRQPPLRSRPLVLVVNPFVATADVVRGRSPTNQAASPFTPLQMLARPPDTGPFSGSTSSEMTSESDGSRREVTIAPDGVRREVTVSPDGTRNVVVDPRPAFPASGEGLLDRVPFWLLSVMAYGLLSTAGLALATRRVAVPRAASRP